MRRIGIFMAQGCEEIEGLMVVDVIRRAGLDIQMIALNNEVAVSGSHKIIFICDSRKKDMNFADLDGIILPGGMPGTLALSADETVQKVIKDFAASGKMVAAICAAPSVLGEAGILQGKKATCHPGFEKKLLGAEFVEAPVVRDGNIITSRGMGTALPFALEIAEYFAGKEAVDHVCEGLVYNR